MTSECILWAGTKDSRGYGREWWPAEQRVRGAYENAWELANGPVPDGLELDHLCMTPACINVDHLEPVTHQENMRRAAAAGLLGGGQRKKTRCPMGHPYSPENTYVPPSGGERMCRTCRREATRRYRERRAAA